MQYITSRELSEKWGISQRRIVRLAMEGRINGAKLYGKSWMFPDDAQKPADGRTKASRLKKEKEPDYFRYPIFEFKNEAAFNPPLTEEELTIKKTVETFNACRFKEADALLGNLPERAQNRYIRMTALYCRGMTSIFLCDTKQFLNCYGKLKTELQEDFPHKAEMREYIHEIDAAIGEDEYYASQFLNQSAYDYHKSFLPRLCNLSALWLTFGNQQITPKDLKSHEINCLFLEETDNVFDLQALHIYLACAYDMIDNKEYSRYHFRKALHLAEKYSMFYNLATMQYYYKPKALKDALQGFPEDLKKRIAKCNRNFHKCIMRFVNAMQLSSLYPLLTENDYIYIAFAVQGLTQKEIAGKMHVSVGTVGNRYSKIYDRLGVKNKEELIGLYHRLT